MANDNKKNDDMIFLVEDDSKGKQSRKKKKDRKKLYKILSILFTMGFFIFAALFIYEVWILPMRIDKSIEKAQGLYNIQTDGEPVEGHEEGIVENTSTTEDKENQVIEDTYFDPNRDQYGRLIEFKDLLDINEDVKGFIMIPNTNIELPVVQSSNGDPEYYLARGWDREPIKSGSLFLDNRSSVEDKSKNLVIHGHNMKSTNNMFHHLLRYKDINFLKENPVFTFDTIYDKGEWKIFAYIITNGSNRKEEFFDYQKSTFKDDFDFMNFIYKLRIRSVYNIDSVDINENDQIITLSTCSYELNDYRTLIVARKVREGEDSTVEPDGISHNPKPLYPETFHNHYGVSVPDLPETFEEALEEGIVTWYKPTAESVEETIEILSHEQEDEPFEKPLRYNLKNRLDIK